jgi:hypothetical protein
MDHKIVREMNNGRYSSARVMQVRMQISKL